MVDHKVAKSSELKLGELLAVKVGNKQIVLARTADGKVFALQDRCSHADVKLSGGKLDGVEIECPAHGAKFNCCSGKNLCMPAVTGVKSYTVKEVQGEIVVEV